MHSICDMCICEVLNHVFIVFMSYAWSLLLGVPSFFDLAEVQNNTIRICKATHPSPLTQTASCVISLLIACMLQVCSIKRNYKEIVFCLVRKKKQLYAAGVYYYVYILNTWYRIIQSWENCYSLVWWTGGGGIIMTLMGIIICSQILWI